MRAGIAETLETSELTSIQQRIADLSGMGAASGNNPRNAQNSGNPYAETSTWAALMPSDATSRSGWAHPFAFEGYLELIGWRGRALHPTRRDFIQEDQAKLRNRLGFRRQNVYQ
ncbi:hypothetical protein F6R98_15335 [Candidatus Methylospira mobilis]|uniref:Uncharacterized protein n=1 Tax=Candidatus Methylospira mobilis TaxID=1808979 RepID=A0A5Q0BNQ3_9GAMM|nr:hypothetical protein [Candidatus Methylospira mobilis]QFY43834.1 hypothetical protein F6R98_15335 [Candidatus Methylospira mobilis]